jgi:hypothetical protein
MNYLPPILSTKQLLDFSKVLSEPAAFTVLYELSYSDEPLGVVKFCKTFGADPAEVTEVLAWLTHHRLVEKKGQTFTASTWAAEALHFLEHAMETAQLDAVDPVSSGDSQKWNHSASPFDGATENGIWSGSYVTVGSVSQAPSPTAKNVANRTQSVEISVGGARMRHQVTFISDDIRSEVGNKVSLVGIYDCAIIFPRLPARLLKLGLFQSWTEVESISKVFLEVRGSALGNTTLKVEAKRTEEQPETPHSIRLALTFGPLDILEPGVLEFHTYFNDQVHGEYVHKLEVSVDPSLKL